MAPIQTEQEINLIELFSALLGHFALIATAAVFCALLAAAYSFFVAVPQYQAVAKLYVVNAKDSVVSFQDLQIGSYLTSDYLEVFKTWEVHREVIHALDLDYSIRQLEGMTTIRNPGGTRVLYITVTSDDPKEAYDIAFTYALVAIDYISLKMSTTEPNILSAPHMPTVPVSPNKTHNVVLAFLFGGFMACVVITLQFVIDDKIKTADDIQKYANLATLGAVPTMDVAYTTAKNAAKRKKQKAEK